MTLFSTLSPVSPTEWGAKVNYDTWRDPNTVDKWVIHYGGGSVGDAYKGLDAERAILRSWENWHINGKGWRGIAYNYAIGMSGTVYRLRGENKGGHTRGDYERDGVPENTEARAVVFILGGAQAPTEEALMAFALMWGEDQKLVIGHRDVFLKGTGGTNTPCPGDNLQGWLAAGKHEDLWRETMAIFKDVPVDHWAAADIEWAVDKRVMGGYGGANAGNFGPADPLTRAAMAVVARNIVRLVAPKQA